MVGSHRSTEGVAGGGWVAADHLSEPQSGELRGADGVSVAVDAGGAHARAAGGDIEVRADVLSQPFPAVHARVLQRQRAAPICEPGAELWAARAALVPAGDHGV